MRAAKRQNKVRNSQEVCKEGTDHRKRYNLQTNSKVRKGACWGWQPAFSVSQGAVSVETSKIRTASMSTNKKQAPSSDPSYRKCCYEASQAFANKGRCFQTVLESLIPSTPPSTHQLATSHPFPPRP